MTSARPVPRHQRADRTRQAGQRSGVVWVKLNSTERPVAFEADNKSFGPAPGDGEIGGQRAWCSAGSSHSFKRRPHRTAALVSNKNRPKICLLQRTRRYS